MEIKMRSGWRSLSSSLCVHSDGRLDPQFANRRNVFARHQAFVRDRELHVLTNLLANGHFALRISPAIYLQCAPL